MQADGQSAPASDAGGGAAGGEDAPLEVPCHLFLPVVPAARVIGKGGASIRAIREESGASVRVLQRELPAEMQRREDRVAVIEGSAAQVRDAVAMVLERVFDRSGLPGAGAARPAQDRALIVEVVVPERSGSHIIGQRGERIRALCGETGCDLHVVKEPMAGLAQHKRVRVTGSALEEVAGAVWRLQELLLELLASGVLRREHLELRDPAAGLPESRERARSAGPGRREVPIRLLIASEEAAWVVGKRGNKIARLRDYAKVQINDADSPPFDASERVVEISSAPLEQRLRAAQLLLEDLALRPEPSAESRLLVPSEHFGSVMGHRGETIRRIMEATGARLQQHKAERNEDGTEYHLRLLEVQGGGQRFEVLRQIYEAIELRGGPSQAGSPGRLLGDAALGGVGGLGRELQAPAAYHGADFDLGAFEAARCAAASPGLPSPAPGLGLGPGGAALEGVPGGHGGASLTLELAMPSEDVARLLASDSSGIAWRAGVKLFVASGAGGVPMLQVVGTAVGNAVACYLVQDRLFMMH